MNPVNGGLAHFAEGYQWPSYRNYIGNRVSPEWLKTEFVLSIVGNNRQQDQYRSFVEEGIDKETHTFFDKKKCTSVFGSDIFRELIHAKLPVEPEIHRRGKCWKWCEDVERKMLRDPPLFIILEK